MAYTIRQKPWKDELWNVSLLPTVKAPTDSPRGPGPAGGQALGRPALLTVIEAAPPQTLPRAA